VENARLREGTLNQILVIASSKNTWLGGGEKKPSLILLSLESRRIIVTIGREGKSGFWNENDPSCISGKELPLGAEQRKLLGRGLRRGGR